MLIDQKEKHIFVKSKKSSNQEKKQLINQEKRIFAKNIDCFVILIDLIFRQNLNKIEKFEFAFFASIHFSFFFSIDILFEFVTIKLHKQKIDEIVMCNKTFEIFTNS